MLPDEKYSSIINLPHHTSATHPRMSMSDRAAQFSPFAALTGYDSAIKETGRHTDDRIELDEDTLTVLNLKLQMLMEHPNDEHEVSFTVFKPDTRKKGGEYLTVTGIVKKIDDFERLIILRDGTKIRMDNVLNVNGEIFDALD